LLVALVAFVAIPALMPPARNATQIAALTPTAAPPTATAPQATATTPATATPTAPAPSPTAPPSPTPLPATPPPTPTRPDLAGPVQAAIAAAIADNAHRDEIEVTVRQAGNAILLEGLVAYVGDKYMLESLAKSVPGVELVDVSGIQVRYAVRSGDSLSGIAQEMYGQSELYPYIAAANGLADPNIIRAGQVLTIPPPH
jgi:nucleoid-associated protein YgaU